MAWETLKTAVAAVIKTNGTGTITGQVLQDIINLNIIPVLGKDRYKGVAVPATAPGTPQNEEYYFAYTGGNYANFGGLILTDGFAILIYKDGVWQKNQINLSNYVKTSDVVNTLTSTETTKPSSADAVRRVNEKFLDYQPLLTDRTEFYTDLLTDIIWNDGFYLNGSGIPTASEIHSHTDFIPVLPLTEYIRDKGSYFQGSYYDANQNYMYSFLGNNGVLNDTFTTPLGVSFVKLNIELADKLTASFGAINSGYKYENLKIDYNNIFNKPPTESAIFSSFPLNTAYAEPSLATINLISSELHLKGTIAEIKIKAQSAGVVKFAAFRKLNNTPNFRPIRYFQCTVVSGVNVLKVNEYINEDFYFGIINSQTAIFTAAGDVGDAVNLFYQVGVFNDNTTWAVTNGRGTNIELKISTNVIPTKNTGKSICLIGDSITDFCNSTSSDGFQYMGFDYFIQQKIKYSQVFNQGYSGIKLGQYGGFADTKIAGLPICDEYTIYLGTNDFALATQTSLGTVNDYLNNTGVLTFYGALRTLIDGIYIKNPFAKIILFTPTHRNYSGLNSWSSVNSNGSTLNDFAEAIRQVSKIMSLKLVDLMIDSGINMSTLSYTTYDNLHPNSYGYQLIGEAFVNEMYDNY